MRFDLLVQFVYEHLDEVPLDDPDRDVLFRCQAVAHFQSNNVTTADVADAVRCADAVRRLGLVDDPT